MTKYIVLNDPHLDTKAPSFRRRDDYLVACLSKLDQIAALCAEHKVDTLMCTGDWFHKKHPQAVSHRLVRTLLDWTHRITDDLRVPILTIIGNHDVQFNDTSKDALLGQPVGTILTNPRVILLDPTKPYLLNGNVLVYGASYQKATWKADGALEEDQLQFWCPLPDTIDEGQWVVHLTHASVVPTPVNWGPSTPVDLALAMSNADIMHTGHIHDDLGIHQIDHPSTRPGDRRSVAWWTNIGSMTRGSLTEETISREPSVLLVELSDDRSGGVHPIFTRLVLTHAPAEEIYDVESYRDAKVQSREFSAWTEQLRQELHGATGQEGAEGQTEKSLEQIIAESTLDSAGRDLALRLLNRAGG
jgi:DNA repair exonuclease SbcCD nuclease subunit